MALHTGPRHDDGAATAADPSLDALVHDALGVPGAGSALLHAFAAQAQALALVLEADRLGATRLPPELVRRVEGAVALTPPWLA